MKTEFQTVREMVDFVGTVQETNRQVVLRCYCLPELMMPRFQREHWFPRYVVLFTVMLLGIMFLWVVMLSNLGMIYIEKDHEGPFILLPREG